MDIERSCGAVIYRKEQNSIYYLVIQHLNEGHWGFPKGHMEEGETERETAIREIKEETGLEVMLEHNFITRIHYFLKNGTPKEVTFFLGAAKFYTVNIQAAEVKDYKWLTLNKACEILTHEDSKNILMKANEYILKHQECVYG